MRFTRPWRTGEPRLAKFPVIPFIDGPEPSLLTSANICVGQIPPSRAVAAML